MMDYNQARSLFQNGDVVFISGGKVTFVRSVITWFTRGEIYHVGMAFWVQADVGSPRLMFAESQPSGYRLVNLGTYASRNMTVMRCPIPWGQVGDIVVDSAGQAMYSLMDLVRIGMHERFGLKIRNAAGGAGYVCSVIVSRILQMGGVTGIETMVSPQRLYDQLSVHTLPTLFVKGNFS